jgi:inner membrane transporter RhtA
MARLARATYALFVALLPATATVVGVIVLRQFPSSADIAGIVLVMLGIGLHQRETPATSNALKVDAAGASASPVTAAATREAT